jgi:hypothetical protein
MSNSNSLGQREFTGEGNDALVGCATSQELWVPGDGDITLGRSAAFDFPIPRFMTCNVAGTLVCTGWSAGESPLTRNVVAGQVIHFRPKSITAAGSTAEVILEY